MVFNTIMETGIIKKALLFAVALVVVILVSYLAGRREGRNEAFRRDFVKVDTLVVRDTITQYEPIIEERVVLHKVPIPVIDTLRIHDTLFVYLERDQVMWQDEFSRVYASGIYPQIDSVRHFIKERVVTRELTKVVKKPCKWSLGVHAGYGVQFGNQIHAAPYVGVGISYNLLSW